MNGRRAFLARSGALALLATLPPGARGAADPSRIALVVGNDRYPRAPLLNAANDARAMADLMGRAGFTVDARIDVARAAFEQGLMEFAERATRPEVRAAFFYYAGHGVQVDWRNYLLPVDADVGSAAELKARCIDLSMLLDRLGRGRNKVFVIILDACRDNPFGAAFVPERKGLSQFDAPAGSLIAFSTAPGRVASDGTGGHGLYTEHLVRELAVPGVHLEDALKRVRVGVRMASRGAQVPWESTSLETNVYLIAPERLPTEEEREAEAEQELAAWKRLADSRDAGVWAEFIRRHPNGKFSQMAQARLDRLIGAPEQVPPNPYSAGVFPLDRSFTVGDEARYSVTRTTAKGERSHQTTLRVTRVDVEGDRVEYNDGAVVTDLLGNPFVSPEEEYDLPVQVNPAELQLGRRWEARFRKSRGGHAADVDLRFQVLRRERIRVPAGEFDAFLIDGGGHMRRVGAGPGRGGSMQMRLWVVPGVNFTVKEERIATHARRPPGGLRLELIGLEQKRRSTVPV